MSFLRGLPFAAVMAVVATEIITSAHAAVLRVPDPYPTIASALQSATSGDSVLVAAGTYFEHDLTLPNGVYLGSESGFLGAVAIDAEDLGHHLVIQDADEVNVVRGIEFQDGSDGTGGSVRITNSSPHFESCRFESNKAVYGGAVSVYGASSPTFVRCEFVSNHGASFEDTAHGGAISTSHGTLPPSAATTTVVECSFVENGAGGGGAIHCLGGSMNLSSSTFVDNRASGLEFGGGGALYFAGGERRVVDCIFDHNVSLAGGDAILADGAQVLIEGSTFARNYSIDKEGNEYGGAAIAAVSTRGNPTETVQIWRSLIAMNLGVALYTYPGSTITISCTDIFGNGLGDWVGPILGMDQENENLALDPLFCGLEAGDFSVARQSPCLPSNNSCSVLIGALGEGCAPLALQPESWGRIKVSYRGDDAPSTTAGRMTP